jgi:hypothetical protein
MAGPPDLAGAQAVKLLIAGGFGVGKTTLVSSVSEIKPLRTEERLSDLGAAVDDITGVGGKTTTTVALDFGRITINPQVVLYLFGTPGQERFWFMWKELSAGALGAVVLADTRRLSDCFGAIDFFETRNIPFIVAVNCFDGADIYDEEEVRDALDISAHIPVQNCDARNRESSKQVLVRLLEHLMATALAPLPDGRRWRLSFGVRQEAAQQGPGPVEVLRHRPAGSFRVAGQDRGRDRGVLAGRVVDVAAEHGDRVEQVVHPHPGIHAGGRQERRASQFRDGQVKERV